MGSSAASIQSWAPDSIQFTIPSDVAGGDQPVNAVVGGVAGNGLTLRVIPYLDSVSPTSGPAGSVITLAGNNFGTQAGSVTVGGLDATVQSWAAGQIEAVVPTGGGTGDVFVSLKFLNVPDVVSQ